MPRRPRPCRCGKQSYDREQAITKAARMQAHPHGQVGHRAIGVYQCELSGEWHVGHRPRVLPKGKDGTV